MMINDDQCMTGVSKASHKKNIHWSPLALAEVVPNAAADKRGAARMAWPFRRPKRRICSWHPWGSRGWSGGAQKKTTGIGERVDLRWEHLKDENFVFLILIYIYIFLNNLYCYSYVKDIRHFWIHLDLIRGRAWANGIVKWCWVHFPGCISRVGKAWMFQLHVFAEIHQVRQVCVFGFLVSSTPPKLEISGQQITGRWLWCVHISSSTTHAWGNLPQV